MKIKINNKLILSLILILTSCDPDRVYEKNIAIPDEIWNRFNIVKFNVEITDTISSHNIYVNIRNTRMYPKSNLFLFIKTTSPTGLFVCDTLECILADEKGKWLGKGLGDIWDNQIPFKKNVRFPNSGIYAFELEQAMRIPDLPFIMDVGLRVEKVN